MINEKYTTKLGSGQGIIEETFALLNLWSPGMNGSDLYKVALGSGLFPNISARRLKNLIFEGFAPRYLCQDAQPLKNIKALQNGLSNKEINQILYLYTCRNHKILHDFVKEIYWATYSSGQNFLSIDEARNFVIRANQDGKTSRPWGASMIQRVPIYLVGTCSDFGLLENKKNSIRKILPFRIEPKVSIFLSYDLHFSGHGDNSVLSHPDWGLFGMDRSDVLNEMKQLALKGWFIIQSAGDVTRIGWQYQSMEEVIDALNKR
ncbi:BrxA family protein [Levilinea saccharolytica]|jgi:hypothetical protein|uniref:BrxA family protein n=1 Tax=Levilinea saccharolytica TaxID=229921 RepID=UPI0009464BCE|nr:BrxA family protein [Levilinea saccharolytica]NPV77430.1 DUF1819 family protein [Anaerolineae bacterium]BCY16546.1 hypothetical protein hrd7_03950 [Leptolinea sp. HRD-7]GAP18984.1 putative inner membrane protein [Levilinea saccharolytica]